MNIDNFKRMARDAGEEGARKAMTDAQRAERLRTRLESMVGKIPEEHATYDQIGRYGLEKMNQSLSSDGRHGEALEYYLAGRASGAMDGWRRAAMDHTAGDGPIARYLRGD